jgi:enoyl-CoA hydratase/carnithine racemase
MTQNGGRKREETMSQKEADLLVEIRDGVAVLATNRPARLNALSQGMIDSAFAAFLEERSPRFTGG